jgi:hypothetical protein
MSMIYGAEHLLRMLGMFSCFFPLFLSILVCFYDKTDLFFVIVVFPTMITSSELDDWSIQILRDYINELLLWVFPCFMLIPLINKWAT